MHYEILRENEIKKYIDDIARLRISVFKEFPYLYQGSIEYEKSYLKSYSKMTNSISVIAIDNSSNIVGASTGHPLKSANKEFKKPFENKFDVDKIFYFAESVLNKNFRGKGIGKQLMQKRIDHVLNLNAYTTICFCAVERECNHPLRPKNYRPLDQFWESYGFMKQKKLTTKFSWPDIDTGLENEKTMTFWIKNL